MSSNRRLCVGFFIVVVLLWLLLFSLLCTDKECAFEGGGVVHTFQAQYKEHLKGMNEFFLPHVEETTLYTSNESYPENMNAFNISGTDVIVFLHIQKTGGTTFGRHLIHDIKLEKPCLCVKEKTGDLSADDGEMNPRRWRKRKGKRRKGRKRCECYRPGSTNKYWLFSRLSTGWRCGLHADWTELTNCVDERLNGMEHEEQHRRYLYITFVRHPEKRYISEYRHVRRGATWKGARHLCGGREPTEDELPPCYTGQNWTGVSLDDFLECPWNLAHNRQTRMLANLTEVHCYNVTAMSRDRRDALMLASAKNNLKDMVFFGLTEYQGPSQYMFEKTFNMSFKKMFEGKERSKSDDTPVTDEQHRRILEKNSLDVELYRFAKELFFKRMKHFTKLNPDDFGTEYTDGSGLSKDTEFF